MWQVGVWRRDVKPSARTRSQRAGDGPARAGRQCLVDSTVTRCDPSLPGALPAPQLSAWNHAGLCGVWSQLLPRWRSRIAIRRPNCARTSRGGFCFSLCSAQPLPRPWRSSIIIGSLHSHIYKPAGPRGPRQQLRALGGGRCLGPIQVPHRAAHHSRSGQQPHAQASTTNPAAAAASGCG